MNETALDQAQSITYLSPTVALSPDISEQELQQSLAQMQSVKQQSASDTVIHPRQGFKIGEYNFMLDYKEASRLIDMPTLHHVPNSPSWFLGVVNLNSLIVPVFDFMGFVGLEHKIKPTGQRLLVLGHGNDAAAIVIDNLPNRLAWSNSNVVESHTAPNALLAHIRHACLINDQLWFDLNGSSLCQAFEQALRH